MPLHLDCNNSKYNNHQHFGNVGFQGLNRYLSKHFIEAGTCKITGEYKTAEQFVIDAINKYPKSRRFVGNLPAEWINKLPIENRGTYVKQVQDLFSDFAEKLTTPQDENFYKYKNFIDDFSNQLKQILKMEVGIKYLDEGAFGKAYKLEAGKNQYVFKVFHSDYENLYYFEQARKYETQGKIIEPARAPYAHKNGHKSFVDFYFGKIGTRETKDGFLLTKFEDYKESPSQRDVIKQLLRILKSKVAPFDAILPLYSNCERNMINLRYIEFATLELVSMEPSRLLKETSKAIEKYLFNGKKTAENKAAILQEIDKARITILELYNNPKIRVNFKNALHGLKKEIQNPTLSKP